jgi:hypothetical protein
VLHGRNSREHLVLLPLLISVLDAPHPAGGAGCTRAQVRTGRRRLAACRHSRKNGAATVCALSKPWYACSR